MLKEMLAAGFRTTNATAMAVTRHHARGVLTIDADLGYGAETLNFINGALRRQMRRNAKPYLSPFDRGIYWDDMSADNRTALVPQALIDGLLSCGFNQGASYRLCGEVEGDVTMLHLSFRTADVGPSERAHAFLLARMLRPAADAMHSSAGYTLTSRELDVLAAAADGLTNADIAQRLFISSRTVATHFEHIYSKLGTSSRARALLLVARRGLI